MRRGLAGKFAESLEAADLKRFLRDWPVFAGRKQRPPLGDWRTWLLLGGRGAGKTRAGAEWLSRLVRGDRHFQGDAAGRVALVGETHDDARAVMVEGQSGVLAVSEPSFRPKWHPARRELVWPNGVVGKVFSAADPEGLRGSQFGAAWCDVVSIAAAFTGIAGITLDPASQAGITEAIVQMISAAGAIIAIHGRLTATEVITRT
jgi:phage terminase large subunit-like protein